MSSPHLSPWAFSGAACNRPARESVLSWGREPYIAQQIYGCRGTAVSCCLLTAVPVRLLRPAMGGTLPPPLPPDVSGSVVSDLSGWPPPCMLSAQVQETPMRSWRHACRSSFPLQACVSRLYVTNNNMHDQAHLSSSPASALTTRCPCEASGHQHMTASTSLQ